MKIETIRKRIADLQDACTRKADKAAERNDLDQEENWDYISGQLAEVLESLEVCED